MHYVFMFVGVEFPSFFSSVPANIEELIVLTAVCNEVVLFCNTNIRNNNSMRRYLSLCAFFFIFNVSFFFYISAFHYKPSLKFLLKSNSESIHPSTKKKPETEKNLSLLFLST